MCGGFSSFVGEEDPCSILLQHNGLHLDILIDRNDPVGAVNPAGVKDVVAESAMTTIQDCEDSVAAVDAEDKCVVYGNWLGLMKGTLEEVMEKGGRRVGRCGLQSLTCHSLTLFSHGLWNQRLG